MSQISVGLQAGGKAYSQVIFFKDRRALEEFESGSFQFAKRSGDYRCGRREWWNHGGIPEPAPAN